MKYSSYLFIACLLLPSALSISLGGLVITPLRAVGIIFFILYVSKLFRKNSVFDSVFLIDVLVIIHCLWAMLSLFVVHGVEKSIESGGMYTLEFLSFYAFGRIISSNVFWVVRLLYMLFGVISVSAFLAWIEMLTGINIIYKLLGLDYARLTETRMGLERASVYMPHPILYGLFATMLGALMVYSLNYSRKKTSLVLVMATIPSLSSAPLISLALQLGISLYDRVFQSVKRRWKILVILIAFLVIALSLASDGGFSAVIVNYMTFNPVTGYYRMSIWEYGSQEVLNNPIFGIGYNDWVRPVWMYSDSVDNFWLLTAMRYGLPGLLMLFIAQYIILRRFIRKDFGTLTPLKVGWVISFVGIFIVGSTVHFWANAFASYGFFLGVGAGIASYSKNVLSFFSKGQSNEVRG